MHGMYGTLDAELEVLRTIKGAELTAFPCLLWEVVGPTMVHVDNKGIVDGLWRGEMRCVGPTAKGADLWISIWEELYRVHQEGLLVEVEHVKVHCNVQPVFICLVEEWKVCEELGPKLKQKWVFVLKKRRSKEASNRVVCGSKQTSVHEVCKKQQTHYMRRTEVVARRPHTNWER